MGFKIIFSPQAIADLGIIVRRVAKNNPLAAKKIGLSLIDRVAILQNFPDLGSAYRKRPNVRKLLIKPYLVFYRVDPVKGQIDILRYWHGARQEPTL